MLLIALYTKISESKSQTVTKKHRAKTFDQVVIISDLKVKGKEFPKRSK